MWKYGDLYWRMTTHECLLSWYVSKNTLGRREGDVVRTFRKGDLWDTICMVEMDGLQWLETVGALVY
jgi:hypothetical protein